MAAGLGFKTFTTGEVLTAGDVNGYLMQGINVFASEAARNAAITSPQEGQFAYTKDNNSLWYYTGSAWAASGATGDIEGVTVTSPLTGGGTSGTVTVGILSGTTSNLGAVQLSDSTSSTSTTLAATANAVKTSYDLAAAAIPKSTVTTAGDVIYATGSGTVTRLGIGTANQVLRVNSGATAPEWATPASGSTFAGCSLYGNNPAISNTTNTAISWTAENFDTDGYHSTVSNTSRITIPTGKGGKYLFNFGAMWEGTNSAFQNRVLFYKNGAQVKHVQYKYQTDNDVSVNVALVLELVATDYVEIFVWQNFGSNRTLYTDNTYGWFQASFLGA